MILQIASLGTDITDAVAEVAEALRYPVLILTLVALLADFFEFGRLLVEVTQRRQKKADNFDAVARQAQATAQAGDVAGAQALLKSQAHGEALEQAYIQTLLSPTALDAERAAVAYDLQASKRLDRIRLLVRAGPALGLMGTLIPLAPALAALGNGDAKVLTDELQTAFAITVVGVAVGLIAFAIALVHERFYSRDLSNIDYLRQLRGDATVVIQTTAPTLATTQVETPTIPGRATAAPAAPGGSTPPAAAPTPTPTAPPAYGQPAAPAEPKKKFGLKKKEKPGAAAAPATPPAPAYPPAPAPAPAAYPPAPAAPAPAAPAPPPPPAPAGGDKSPSIPTHPPQDDDPSATGMYPAPPSQ